MTRLPFLTPLVCASVLLAVLGGCTPEPEVGDVYLPLDGRDYAVRVDRVGDCDGLRADLEAEGVRVNEAGFREGPATCVLWRPGPTVPAFLYPLDVLADDFRPAQGR